MFNYGNKLRNRYKVNKVLNLKLSDKRLSTLLKEVLANIKEFDQDKHFKLMDTRKHIYRV